MTVQRKTAHLYVCNECRDRFVGYGDEDEEALKWISKHNSWHAAGIQENGRWVQKNPPPKNYMTR